MHLNFLIWSTAKNELPLSNSRFHRYLICVVFCVSADCMCGHCTLETEQSNCGGNHSCFSLGASHFVHLALFFFFFVDSQLIRFIFINSAQAIQCSWPNGGLHTYAMITYYTNKKLLLIIIYSHIIIFILCLRPEPSIITFWTGKWCDVVCKCMVCRIRASICSTLLI